MEATCSGDGPPHPDPLLHGDMEEREREASGTTLPKTHTTLPRTSHDALENFTPSQAPGC